MPSNLRGFTALVAVRLMSCCQIAYVFSVCGMEGKYFNVLPSAIYRAGDERNM